jgi:hypothetical protein
MDIRQKNAAVVSCRKRAYAQTIEHFKPKTEEFKNAFQSILTSISAELIAEIEQRE